MGFSISLNLSNAAGTAVPPEKQGLFHVEIISGRTYETKNNNMRAAMLATVVEGPDEGKTINFGILVPADKDDWPVDQWEKFLVCIGWGSSEAKAKFNTNKSKLDFDRDISGRRGHLWYIPKAGENEYESVEWYTPSQAARARSALSNNNGSSPDVLDDYVGF
jgi:hypothetical protein